MSPDNVVTLDDDRTAMSEVCDALVFEELRKIDSMLMHRASSPILAVVGTAKGERCSDDPPSPMFHPFRIMARMAIIPLLPPSLPPQPNATPSKSRDRCTRPRGGLRRVSTTSGRVTALVCLGVLLLVHSGSLGNLPRDIPPGAFSLKTYIDADPC